jgi:hypothetical protein
MTPRWLGLALLAWSLNAAPGEVNDCRPCTFTPGPNLPAYRFEFQLKSSAEGRSVESISVTRAGPASPVQNLPVGNFSPLAEDQPFFFGGEDINGDGYLDLLLITRRGAANAYADYWLFQPAAGTYAYLGNYPVFRIDAPRHRLLTYERGGMGGMIFESREYAFQGSRIVLMQSVKQEATPRPGVFRKVTRERVGGILKIVRAQTVKAP